MLLLFLRLRVNQHIIDEDYHELVQERSEHLIHQCHKDCRCISQPERHQEKLKVTISRPKCSLRNILLSDSQLMVYPECKSIFEKN